MASEYETVADIVKELRGIKGGQHTNGGLSFERWQDASFPMTTPTASRRRTSARSLNCGSA